jgi:tetratricopeptide (TPR) repeat protein
MKLNKGDSFFTKLDWAAFWTATLLTFVVYFFTLGPSVGLEDSGELATAGAHLGVPHPPGYPFWTLCSWLFCKLFSWVTYMGHPTPAWAISCFSAVAGAFAAGCTAMLICRSAHDFIGDDGEKSGVSGMLSFGGAVAGALTFALSPVEWSQSTIVEIYSLNALSLMWVFLLSYRWMRKPSDKILFFTAFVFGLGLTNYQVLLFAIVPLAIIILMTNIALFRDVFIYLIPVALTYQVLQIGQLVRADRTMSVDAINKHAAITASSACPSTFFIILGLLALVGALAAAAYLRDRGDSERARKIALAAGGGGAALVLLSAFVFTGKNEWTGIYAPVAPLVEPWRYALIAALIAGSVIAAALAALEECDRLVESKQLKFLGASAAFAVLAVIFAVAVPEAGSNGYAGAKYPWGKSISMFWTLIALLFTLCAKTKKGLCFAIPAAGMQIAVFTLLRNGAMNGLTHPQSWWFGWPIAWNFVLLALAWLTLPHGRSVAGAAFFAQLGVSFYAYMPIVSDLRNPPMNWGYPRTWEGFKHAIMRGQYEAIGVPSFTGAGQFFDFIGNQMVHYFEDVKVQFTDLLLLFAPVPFIAGHWVVAKERRKPFWQWMGAAAACFLMMSFLLILLANVKGDVQDGFIQKVKFISSHAMIALWIGYGLVFAGALLVRFVQSAAWLRLGSLASAYVTPRRAAIAFSALAVLVAFVYPIVQNYTDDRMVFELGGCEQNGHTFGWQFGAYQLDGAKAINEQLVADEEPLPDPDWPEPMEPFSIFFGGTDPGRFVPTYMIYAANFRPDVYLITQNALADETYMSVERDLYGDEIWIPSKDDGGDAFGIYVDEVHRGVRQANGDLRIENGKVQVTGALGVMEINGIITKMMFDHDRLRHSFYIEESYVINWMYPYLSPHGLIMKINKDATPYDAVSAEKDQDFWDWYTRRLLKDPMYRRDFAAQKSFSKLRASIAGLYAHQGRYDEAAQAFREACMLYPASPEAAFRYIRECLVEIPLRRWGSRSGAKDFRWDVALELMDYTDLLDPRNKRTVAMRDFIRRMRELVGQIASLEEKARREGRLSSPETFALAHAYFAIGKVSTAAQLARPLVDSVGEPFALKSISTILLEAKLYADAERCLEKYLKAEPGKDAMSWIELAKLQYKTGRVQAAQRSFVAGYNINPKTVFEKVQRDQDLYEIAAPLFMRKK